ncbi:MAG: hypothetical protein JSW00_15550 [Thermoplasmata archaeon]|nr:MAG: hypothetical protein JSW00_15550 [Thermoplasmata archaeon]
MPKESKKTKQKKKVEDDEKEEEKEKEVEDPEEVQKTSIQISTKVRDRLWRLKFRKTYDEFLWELCELYEKEEKEE